MKVVVFGSGGFIGRRLMQRLADSARWQAVGLSSARPGGVDPATGLLPTDFTLPQGTDAVVYLAQSPHYRRLPEMVEHVHHVNVLSAVRAAQAACDAGARRFLYASTGSVYAPGFTPLRESSPLRRDRWYPLSKLHAEEALALFGEQLSVTALRPFGVYGPGQRGMLVARLVDAVRSGRAVTLQPADSVGAQHVAAHREGGLRTSLCYVDDAAAVIERLLDCEAPPAAINLAGPEPVSIRQIAETIGRLVGVAPRFELAEGAREGDLVADTQLLSATVGVSFTTLEAGLRATVEADASLAVG